MAETGFRNGRMHADDAIVSNSKSYKALNNAGDGNISLIGANTQDQVVVGDGNIVVGEAGATGFADPIRLPNNTPLIGRNAANSADVALIRSSAAYDMAEIPSQVWFLNQGNAIAVVPTAYFYRKLNDPSTSAPGLGVSIDFNHDIQSGQVGGGQIKYESLNGSSVYTRFDFMTAVNGNLVLSARLSGDLFLTPNQPYFTSTIESSTPNITGNGDQFQFENCIEHFDVGGNFNPVTGVFTAPATGLYHFEAQALLSGIDSGHTDATIRLIINGSFTDFVLSKFNPYSALGADGTLIISGSIDVMVDQGHTVGILLNVMNGTKTVGISSSTRGTRFLGYLIG